MLMITINIKTIYFLRVKGSTYGTHLERLHKNYTLAMFLMEGGWKIGKMEFKNEIWGIANPLFHL